MYSIFDFTKTLLFTFTFTFILLVTGIMNTYALQESGSIGSWSFNTENVDDNAFIDKNGNLNARSLGSISFVDAGDKTAIELNGTTDSFILTTKPDSEFLPLESFTVEAWVQVMMPVSWGGIVSAFQHNGSYQRGWLLGFRGDVFSFALKSEGVGEDGSLTYLNDPTPYELGKWYHVVGTYDGQTQKLYVNGELVNTATTQQGKIHYPPRLWYEIGAYHDDDEYFRLNGKLFKIDVHTTALDQTAIKKRFDQNKSLTEIPSEFHFADGFLVYPYLQFITKTEATVIWEMSEKYTGKVLYGKNGKNLDMVAKSSIKKELHKVRLTNLEPAGKYFYKVIVENENGATTESELLTFQTAVTKDDAIRFSFIADTQHNPLVWGQIANLIWDERPHFVVHAGDIVGDGRNRFEWYFEYLMPGKNLISRVPVYKVMGNHENNSDNYFRYTDNQTAKNWYSFTFGNTVFFMVDSNLDTSVNSEQYQWLENALAHSNSLWKIVIHHHPPFTSEENDYGNSWIEPSLLGDPKTKPLVALYDNYNVDFVLSGHLHTYERTWPIRNNKIDLQNGTVYIISGGAGGRIEGFAPTPSWFSNTVYLGHHYTLFNIFDTTIEFKMVTIDGIIKDSFSLTK